MYYRERFYLQRKFYRVLFFRLLVFLSTSALKPPAVSLADFKEITPFPAVPHRFFITARWRSGKESAC